MSEERDGTDQPECTDRLCKAPATYAVYYPDDEEYSRENGDGDLHPFVCENCVSRYRRQLSEFGEFVDYATHTRQQTLLADGGTDTAVADVEDLPDEVVAELHERVAATLETVDDVLTDLDPEELPEASR